MKQQGSISRHVLLKAGRWTQLLVGLLLGNLAQAATTYTFNNDDENWPPCSGRWEANNGNKSFTCTGRVTLASGDKLVAEHGNSNNEYDITVIANDGFDLNNNTIGTAAGTISLESTSGTIVAIGSNNTFSASVTSGSGAITLSNAVIVGSVQTTSGAVTLDGTSGSVGGSVLAGGAVTATNIAVTGDLSSESEDKAITLTGGSVGGAVWANGAITSTDTAVAGYLTSKNGAITLTRSGVGGYVLGSGAITATDNRIDGSLTSQHGALTLTNSDVGGDVWAQGAITGTFILVIGSLHSENGAVTLTDSRIFGTVSAGGAITLTRTAVGSNIDHFEISAPTSGLTCNPLDVTVKACLNEACDLYTGSVIAQVQITQGVTTNSQAKTFTGGIHAYALRAGKIGEAVLSMGPSMPSASSQTLCRIGSNDLSTDCTLQMVESGFVLFDPQADPQAGNSLIPSHIAGRPTLNDVWVRAVKSDPADPLSCIPGFSEKSERKVGFASDYISPELENIVGSPKLKVNGVEISNASSAFTPVPLSFNAQAEAPIRLLYPDAGRLSLSLRYDEEEADTGLVMTSTGNTFVVRPYGLCVSSGSTGSSCTSGDAECSAFVPAGDSFDLSVKAVAWEAGVDTDFCSVGTFTPNYRQNGITLTRSLVAPVPGDAGDLGETNVNIVDGDAGENTLTNQTISEVGVFTITADPPANYLGGPPVGDNNGDGIIDKVSTSANIGRFIPGYLDVDVVDLLVSLEPSCGSFSYQGQPMRFVSGMEPSLRVSGYNRVGGVTTNYDRGDFWRLKPPAIGAYASVTAEFDATDPADLAAVAALASRDTRLTSQGPDHPTVSGANSGDGEQVYRWSDEALRYAPATLPGRADYPFRARIRQTFSAAALTDADGACYLDGTTECQPFTYDFAELPGSEVRLGRLRIGNAHGSELQALNLPLSIETWQATAAGSSFVREGLDNCSAGVLGAPVLEGFSGKLAAGETTARVMGPAAGVGLLELMAPGAGNTGSVRVYFGGPPSPALAPTWLHYDWNGTGRQAAQGTATFGIYHGPQPLIFRRELYR